MEFVMIVEPDEVGRKRLEAVFQTEKPSFSYQITGIPEEAVEMTAYGSSYFFSAVADVVTETASANRRQTSMGDLKFP